MVQITNYINWHTERASAFYELVLNETPLIGSNIGCCYNYGWHAEIPVGKEKEFNDWMFKKHSPLHISYTSSEAHLSYRPANSGSENKQEIYFEYLTK